MLAERGFVAPQRPDVAQRAQRKPGYRVQKAVVVDEPFVSHRGNVNAGAVEFAGIRLAFVAQHIISDRLDQRRGKSRQVLYTGLQRRRINFPT